MQIKRLQNELLEDSTEKEGNQLPIIYGYSDDMKTIFWHYLKQQAFN
jgi:hypothetical protein